MDCRAPETAVQPEFFKILQSIKKENPNEKIRFVIDIQQENLDSVKKLIDAGYEARHIGGLKGNFGITRTDYLYFVTDEYGKLPKQMVWSTNAVLLEQMKNIFDNLWESAIPSKSRIDEIENENIGTTSPRIEVSSDPIEIKEKFLELVNSVTVEIQIVFPTQASFLREEIIGVNEALDKAAIERGVKIRMLSPLDNLIREKISSHRWNLSSEISSDKAVSSSRQIIIREIDVASSETKVTFAVFDRSRSFIIELGDNSKLEFEKAIGLATYSNSKPTVSSYIAFFEKLWHESELRESEMLAREKLVESLAREEKATRQAKLLQDILTHDIVNYNQIIRLQAELMGDLPSKDDVEFSNALKTIITAIEGSTSLLERARKLGKVMSDQSVKLSSRNLLDSINNSYSLVIKANPSKKVSNQLSVAGDHFAVLGDDFLDEIFINIYSNAVKYTDSQEVVLNTVIEDDKDFWLIKVIDQGRGIPEEAKYNIYDRYSGSAKGSGLGMSIARALAVDRYAGRISLKNRVEGDYSKGTLVEIWLPKAEK